MTSLTDTNSSAFTYEFDGDGNRTKQSKTGCLSARYVYDGPNAILELNASNQVVNAYVNSPGIDQPIERISFVSGTQSTRLVYHTDGLGSVAAMTDASQQTAKSYAYEALGRVRAETGQYVVDRYTYTAREALGDSLGFYFYRNRVMDPNTGRFTSEDPLRLRASSVNLYQYAHNGPIDLRDPMGLWPTWEQIKGFISDTWETAAQVAKEVWADGSKALTSSGGNGISPSPSTIAQSPGTILPAGYSLACISAKAKAEACYSKNCPDKWDECDKLNAIADKICNASQKVDKAFNGE